MTDSLKQKCKGSLATILDNLSELEDEACIAFIDWTVAKSRMYSEAIFKKKFQVLPDRIVRGDIIFCQFGTNVFPEFSDKKTRKHYAIVWLQQGLNLTVIPITQRKPKVKNPYLISLGPIPGMPAKCNYARMDAIRSVSLRRISRISGTSQGKITFPPIKEKINDAFTKLFIDN